MSHSSASALISEAKRPLIVAGLEARSADAFMGELATHAIDVVLDPGPSGRSVRLGVQPFTLVGATTRAGLLTSPLRDRFGIVQRLEFYGHDELQRIVERSARLLNVEASTDGALYALDRGDGHRSVQFVDRARR